MNVFIAQKIIGLCLICFWRDILYSFMKKFLLAIGCLMFAASLVFARIGETKKDLESRLLSRTGGALEYDKKEEKKREAFDLPYRDLFLIMPREADHSFYFKRPDKVLAQSSDVVKQDDMYGWEVHVCYLNGKSVMEFYRRRGDKITFEEVAALMKLTAGEDKVPPVKWEALYPIDKTPLFTTRGNYIYFSDEFREDYPEQMPKSMAKQKPSEVECFKDSEYADIIPLLPMARNRHVELEVNPGLKNSPAYANSIARQIMDDEQEKAFAIYKEKYNPDPKEREKERKKQQQQRLQQQQKPQNATRPQNTSSADVRGINYGERPRVAEDKTVHIFYKIPVEDGTSVGYTMQLSTGKIRAKFYSDAILFIDSEFDESLRKELERLYAEQFKKRVEESKESTNRF